MKIDESLYLTKQPTNQTKQSDLGKDEFLKLLMAQLKHQDPLDPMDDKQFISQMATFSQLEQSINMSETMKVLTNQQSQSNFLAYSNLINKEITYAVYDSTGEYSGKETGRVQSVSFTGNDVMLKLSNEDKIAASQVMEITQPTHEVIDDGE